MVFAGAAAGVAVQLLAARRGAAAADEPGAETQLALLTPVRWSPGTKLGMLALRGYLVIGAVLLLVKAIQLGGG